MGDIDHFKKINDKHGHFEGDKALQIVSKTLQDHIRSTDIFGRWGGEEFLIVCYDSKLEDANIVAQKLRIEVENLSSKLGYGMSMSFGVSESKLEDTDPYMVVKRSDENMYKAKRAGRNQVVAL